MKPDVVVDSEEGAMKLKVIRRADGKIERATFTVYEIDGARTASLDADGARVIEIALCPPEPVQGPGSEGSA